VTGERVLENHDLGWIWKSLLGAAIGAMMMRLWDALRFESKFATKDDVKSAFAEFQSSHVQPIRERVSKFDNKIEAISNDLGEIKSSIAAIKAALKVRE